jgi:hypothetical protein
MRGTYAQVYGVEVEVRVSRQAVILEHVEDTPGPTRNGCASSIINGRRRITVVRKLVQNLVIRLLVRSDRRRRRITVVRTLVQNLVILLVRRQIYPCGRGLTPSTGITTIVTQYIAQ